MSNRIPVFLAFAHLLFSQGGGAIGGSVTDATGAAIAKAKVTIANEETGVAIESETTEAGLYRAGSLVPGSYRVEVEIAGFERLIRRLVRVEVGQVVALDLTLRVGAASEALTVMEAPPMVDSQSSSVAQAVNRQMLAALPMANRAASSLVALAPGVVMIDNGRGTAENYPVFSVAGGRARNQNFTLDGGNVTNAVGLTRPQQLTSLPVDAMQEFRVVANSYSAEYGHSTSGVIVMSTRSGTNDFRGSAFESLQNTVLNARNFFASTRPAIRLNQYGLALGGPIRKDKTHFFASWERTRQLTSETALSTVPTIANRGGDFSDLRNGSGSRVPIFDPLTTAGSAREAFAGNLIPASRFDSVARAALAYYPLPNRTGAATNANNYAGSSSNTLDRDIVVARLDHQVRPRDLVMARYYVNDAGSINSGTYGNPAVDPAANLTDVRVQSILGNHVHVFNPAVTNDFRFTYLRRKFIDTRAGLQANLAGAIGLRGVSAAAFPAFTVPGYATLGNPAAVFRIQTPIQDAQVLDTLSWYKSKHAVKAGFEARLGGNDEIRDRSSSGSLTISPLITSLPGVSGTGNALASLLLGEVNAGAVQVSDKIRTRAQYIGLFVQDDYRLTNRLTINAGLRWETELPRRELDNRMNSFDALAINPVSGTPGVVTFAGANGTPERAFRTDVNNFAPRLGFAYRIPGLRDTVLRGGAGVFYASTVSNTIGDTASLGFSDSASFVVPQADLQSAFHLRDGFPAFSRPARDASFGAVALGQRPTTSISFFNPKQVAPISYQYNAGIQRELTTNVVVEFGYIGNVSHHLTANDFSLNQVRPELMGAGNAQLRRPFPQFSNVTWINPSIGNSSYHAGFVRAEKRFSGGLAFLAHYTFSKFLDDVESSTEYGATGSYMDAYNRHLDKARSGSDVPQRLLVTLQYELPAIRNRRWLNRIAGGWKVGLLETGQSGAPFSVASSVNTTNAFSAGPMRPDLLRDPRLGADRSITRWFETAAFAAPAQFRFGNSPRSVLRGPRLVNTDATLEKRFAIREKTALEIRAEFFNLLNHASFDLPGSVFGAADFGAITSARNPRTIQAAARWSF
ncbi:MAG: carboxypeptidase regulatory-like domain-containing protein [Bryobacteraceae bacterium]